ncbi:Lysophospholipase L1 [Modestobacter sp. DSM 44400]|uniref:SGNH/GDSL hydrolase family protein n=1 Tax=Modestobacter sp. DSM 44400 TaxID=1550230 RepID=UPI0008978B79|nr:GDSL-type esterase/lipase family protein [Modestobacter sp. DSM 44400]SDX55206.1 Lysophospholipase L1 [Modestobacter sp. DSM 44400]
MTRRLITAFGALVSLGVTGCAASAAGQTSAVAPSPAPGVVRVAVVGDSITEADSLDFDDGDIGPGSWARRAEGGAVQVVGGWAHGGATTADMVAGVRALDADVLVLMAGSNDLDADVAVTRIADGLVTIATEAEVPRVLLSTVPPEDGYEQQTQDLNRRLRVLARDHGWELVDAMAGVRGADGGWLPGMSEDGVHPDEAGADVIGAALRTAILRTAGTTSALPAGAT